MNKERKKFMLKALKLISFSVGILVTLYLLLVAVITESIPNPTKQQLSEAKKVAEDYLKEKNGVEIVNTSASHIGEMYDRTIHVEGYSKVNPQQVLRVSFDQLADKNEIVTEKLINKICTSNDKGKNFKCNVVKKLE